MREAIAVGFFTLAALLAYGEALLFARALRRVGRRAR